MLFPWSRCRESLPSCLAYLKVSERCFRQREQRSLIRYGLFFKPARRFMKQKLHPDLGFKLEICCVLGWMLKKSSSGTRIIQPVELWYLHLLWNKLETPSSQITLYPQVPISKNNLLILTYKVKPPPFINAYKIPHRYPNKSTHFNPDKIILTLIQITEIMRVNGYYLLSCLFLFDFYFKIFFAIRFY